MITKVIRGILKNNPMFRFSSSAHHDSHQVHLDPNASWVEYKHSKELVSLYGFNDVSYHIHEDHSVDPYPHLRNVAKFSLDNLVFTDAFHHVQEHDQLYNQQNGYLFGDDPLDTRQDIALPIFAALTVGLFGILFVYASKTPLAEDEAQDLNRKNIIAQEIDVLLQRKKQIYLSKLAELKELEDQLQ